MPDKLSELLMDDSFIRFIKGKASEQEEKRWLLWMQKRKENKTLVKKAQRLLGEGVHTVPKPNSKRELNRLMNRVDLEHRYASIQQKKRKHKKLVWATISAAAGILLLVGFLARHSLFQNDGTESSRAASINYHTVETKAGEKSTAQYSDGSKIVINANSKMRLPDRNTGADTMQVWLEGEAYFDITRNPDSESRTFIVHTPDGDVSVLGTKFAVNTMQQQSRVVLAEGSIRVNVRDSLKNKRINYTLKPGEMALFSSSVDSIQVEEVNTEAFTSWASGTLIMDKTPLADLIDRIEFTYDVKVEVENEALLKQKLTGKFKNVNLEFLLEGLAKTLDIEIQKHNNTVYIKEKNAAQKSTQSE